MLLQLTIHNFAIVKFLELELNAGMTAITGETGAGKSIAIDALGLCLGERAEASMVRPGAERCEVIARFSLVGNLKAQEWLKANALDQEGECLLRRILSPEGRSRSYINGVPVPLVQLKALGQMLVNIHGQHAHQQLIHPDYQLQLLDGCAGHTALLDEVRGLYNQWRQRQNELNQLQREQQQREARRQLLEYQVEELNEFAPQPDEFEEIEERHRRLSNSSELVQESNNCLNLLADDDEANVLALLRHAQSKLEQLQEYDSALASIAAMLDEAMITIDESQNELRHYLDRVEVDPRQLELLEERITRTMTLARKHHVKPEVLPAHHQALAAELQQLGDDEDRIQSLEQEIALALSHYQQAALSLSQSRVRYAQELGEAVTRSMRELAMPQGEFAVTIRYQEGSPSPLGGDQVEFLVTTNPGQPLQPLGKVASGGELSRLSLALVVIGAKALATPTLIFDEVDVGISGPTAAVVGRLLRQLGESTQVMVVTHLPQVAGQGHQHMVVNKVNDGKTTETNMIALNEELRLNELARLLGGDQITHNTLANARELLHSSSDNLASLH